jgi:hypothetical protein
MDDTVAVTVAVTAVREGAHVTSRTWYLVTSLAHEVMAEELDMCVLITDVRAVVVHRTVERTTAMAQRIAGDLETVERRTFFVSRAPGAAARLADEGVVPTVLFTGIACTPKACIADVDRVLARVEQPALGICEAARACPLPAELEVRCAVLALGLHAATVVTRSADGKVLLTEVLAGLLSIAHSGERACSPPVPSAAGTINRGACPCASEAAQSTGARPLSTGSGRYALGQTWNEAKA